MDVVVVVMGEAGADSALVLFSLDAKRLILRDSEVGSLSICCQ